MRLARMAGRRSLQRRQSVDSDETVGCMVVVAVAVGVDIAQDYRGSGSAAGTDVGSRT